MEAFKQKMKEKENADKSDSSDNTEIDESSVDVNEKSTLLPTSASIHDPISTILGNSEVSES